MKKLLILLVVLAALAAGAWYFFGHKQAEPPRVVETAPVAKGTVRKVLESTGIIKAQVGAQVKIGARASGTVEKMLVKVGDRVKAGDLIAVIDAREVTAQRDEAVAGLAKAESELARVQRVFPLQIAEATAAAAKARADKDYAEKNYARRKQLVDKELEARDVLDQATQAVTVQRNEVQARETTLQRLRAEWEQELVKARRGVDEARASLETATVRLSYYRVKSPISGVVSQVTAQEGETLVSGLQVSSIVTVLDPTRLEMWIYVDETDVGQVAVAMPVEFTVDAYPGRIFKGAVGQIYPQPEIRDNIVYYQAIVTLDQEQAQALRPEMTTQCQVVVQEKKDVLVIPNTALKWVGSERLVFVQDVDGAVRRVNPKLGLMGLRESEVVSGLSEGDQVATQVIVPGVKAETRNDAAPQRPKRNAP